MDGIPPLQERSGQKRGCIDDIIDHMTAEFGGGYEGQYIQFLNGPPQPMPPQVANSQPPSTSQHPQAPWPAPPGVLSPGGIPGSPTAAPPVYYPQSGELGMMDVGNGNFVVYQTKPAPDFGATQPVGFIHYPAPQPLAQPQGLSAPQPPHLIDYSAPRPFSEQIQANGGCLIENVVGNWAPNRNGTYSPFGGLRGQDEPISGGTNQQQNVAVVPPVARSQTTLDQQQSPLSAPTKKPRIVAEVKPMRPSYSDVLAKSPPLTPPPTTKAATKHIVSPQEVKTTKTEGGSAKKTAQSKSSANAGKAHSVLKRQNSSGSEEALLEKVKIPVSRWSSAEDLTSAPPARAQDQQKKEKKKRNYKSQTPSEREELIENVSSEAEIKSSRRKDSSPGGYGPNLAKATSERSGSKAKTREERKGSGVSGRNDRGTQSARKATGKRSSPRTCRKRESHFGALMNKWKEQASLYFMYMASWLLNLLWDVTAMSTTLLLHLFRETCNTTVSWLNSIRTGLNGSRSQRWWNVWLRNSWRWITWWKKEDEKPEQRGKFPKKPTVDPPPLPGSLTHNISLPTTGEEAMKRLLSCKGKDPYSILGVTSTCTDEEIKKYYKSQALLVHPDKNSQPGAEEAFKILVHAFDLIAEPEKRAAYNRYVAETNQVEQAWSELSDLLSQLHEKMEYAANTIRCNNCGKRHKRQMTDRPSYAARFCAQCKIHHSAKEGDMWAESKGWSSWWGVRYYACMEGNVYDITQWANCQGNTIQKVKPDSHSVQYRVLMGRAPQHNPPPEPDIEDLLNSLYSQNGASGRSKKKSKKNK